MLENEALIGKYREHVVLQFYDCARLQRRMDEGGRPKAHASVRIVKPVFTLSYDREWTRRESSVAAKHEASSSIFVRL